MILSLYEDSFDEFCQIGLAGLASTAFNIGGRKDFLIDIKDQNSNLLGKIEIKKAEIEFRLNEKTKIADFLVALFEQSQKINDFNFVGMRKNGINLTDDEKKSLCKILERGWFKHNKTRIILNKETIGFKTKLTRSKEDLEKDIKNPFKIKVSSSVSPELISFKSKQGKGNRDQTISLKEFIALAYSFVGCIHFPIVPKDSGVLLLIPNDLQLFAKHYGNCSLSLLKDSSFKNGVNFNLLKLKSEIAQLTDKKWISSIWQGKFSEVPWNKGAGKSKGFLNFENLKKESFTEINSFENVFLTEIEAKLKFFDFKSKSNKQPIKEIICFNLLNNIFWYKNIINSREFENSKQNLSEFESFLNEGKIKEHTMETLSDIDKKVLEICKIYSILLFKKNEGNFNKVKKDKDSIIRDLKKINSSKDIENFFTRTILSKVSHQISIEEIENLFENFKDYDRMINLIILGLFLRQSKDSNKE